jgi:large subunit ribosomal protein L24
MRTKYKKKLVKPQLSFHVRRGDTVFILTGKDKGKSGLVQLVNRQTNRVLVEAVNVVNGKERSLHISNVALFKAEG